MKSFVNKNVGHVLGEKERFEKLVLTIHSRSLLDFKATSKGTYNAMETFERREGNCLSYSVMFVSMARYLGLKATFQEVNDLSSWSSEKGVLIFSRHINVLITADGKKYEVDFSSMTNRRFMRREKIGDERALAHYYNNLGVDALLKNEYALGEDLFDKSLSSDITFSSAWANYGFVKERKGEHRAAENCYKRAFGLDKENYTARFNLSELYEKEGKLELAVKVKSELKRYLKNNPYYQFNLGTKAFESGDINKAIKYFRRAHKKMKKEPEFCARLAESYFRIGNIFATKKYINKLERICVNQIELNSYRKKLKYIYLKLN